MEFRFTPTIEDFLSVQDYQLQYRPRFKRHVKIYVTWLWVVFLMIAAMSVSVLRFALALPWGSVAAFMIILVAIALGCAVLTPARYRKSARRQLRHALEASSDNSDFTEHVVTIEDTIARCQSGKMRTEFELSSLKSMIKINGDLVLEFGFGLIRIPARAFPAADDREQLCSKVAEITQRRLEDLLVRT